MCVIFAQAAVGVEARSLDLPICPWWVRAEAKIR